MEKYMFEASLRQCRYVPEVTSYLEIFCHSNPIYNTVEEHPLTPDEFLNFLHRRGTFSPPRLPDGTSLISGLRLILQQNAQDPDTFAPLCVSLKPELYSEIIQTFRLPPGAIESTSCVGPFFWATIDKSDENPVFQVVQRKSDVRKKGKTRGWELMLSYSFSTGITTGYCKGTPSSDIGDSIIHLKACGTETCHPLLLPLIILSHDASFKPDIKQRDARDWLRRLEHAISMWSEIVEKEGYVMDGVVDLDAVNRDLVECHAQVLWKRPIAFLRITDSFKDAMALFYSNLSVENKRPLMQHVHATMLSRMEFYKRKWEGIDTYASTTLERIETQKSSLYNIIAQKESKLNFQLAGEQRKLAHASKRDSSTMKTISLLGSIFLPGAYLASIFSTTFFNFQNAKDIPSAVAPSFWLYWAVTIPVTLLVVGMWLRWERKRQARYDQEDMDLEKGTEEMERTIMSTMRQRTTTKFSAWDERVVRKQTLARDEDNDFGAFKEPKPPARSGTHLEVPTVHF